MLVGWVKKFTQFVGLSKRYGQRTSHCLPFFAILLKCYQQYFTSFLLRKKNCNTIRCNKSAEGKLDIPLGDIFKLNFLAFYSSFFPFIHPQKHNKTLVHLKLVRQSTKNTCHKRKQEKKIV